MVILDQETPDHPVVHSNQVVADPDHQEVTGLVEVVPDLQVHIDHQEVRVVHQDHHLEVAVDHAEDKIIMRGDLLHSS